MPPLWADTPLSLITDTGLKDRSNIPAGHACIGFAQSMALLHNIIIRAFNASYNQCLSVKPDTVDASDFLFFNQALYYNILHHHDAEEEILFPEMAKLTGISDIMEQNIQEHRDFDEGLEKFRAYVFETEAKAYDGKKLQQILDFLGPKLHKHLLGEIPTLLDLAKYDSKKLQAIFDMGGKKAREQTDFFRDVPITLACGDSTFLLDGQQMNFPPVPSLIKYVAKYVLERRHAGAWRFNPCDAFGIPRPLAFPNP
ncbi:hypothetical protein FQN50_005253 [Emmonsiellopsis sp. PD_5]|nr:hypothetical protein FQN50_005253 [Emmonsiellopsis sp. PD_5]